MNKIRIGKDFDVRWSILTNGETVDLAGRDLLLELYPPFHEKIVLSFNIEGNTIIANISPDIQTSVGVYSLTLWENYGKDGQTAVDSCQAFALVSSSCAESDDSDTDVELKEVVELQTANMTFTPVVVGSGTIEIDAELSLESENPVQNKVVTKAVKDAHNAADSAMEVAINAQAAAEDAEEVANSKQDKISDLDAIRSGAAKGATALQEHQDISGKLDKTEAATLYQPKGNYQPAGNYQPVGNYATSEALQNEITRATNEEKNIRALAEANKQAIENLAGSGGGSGGGSVVIVVDPALSETSENPVQNKVVTAGINEAKAAAQTAQTAANEAKTAAGTAEQNAKDYTADQLKNYAKTEDLPTVPTKTSELTNDSGFITAAQIPDVDTSNLATKAELAAKQDTIADLATIREGASKGATALQEEQFKGTYSLPQDGIPKSDLSQSVQESLDKIPDLEKLIGSHNKELKFFAIEPVTVRVGEVEHQCAANEVATVFVGDEEFEVIPTSNNSIQSLSSYPIPLTWYDWLDGVEVFSNIVFDMNQLDTYKHWIQYYQGDYRVQKAQYVNCVFWSDKPYTHSPFEERTNYTIYYSAQLPLCYSTIPANTYKPFYLAYGVNTDPNWQNPDYVASYAAVSGATQTFSYYGANAVGIFDMAVDIITLPKDCRGLMYHAPALSHAGVFDAINTTNFGAKKGSWQEAFGDCYSLEDLFIKNLKTSINISWSPINNESMAFIVDNAANTSAITISVSPYTYYRLTDEIKAAATAKNITIALLTGNLPDDRRWDSKVDKVEGKQLTTEDFTAALKEKLEGLSNYDDTAISEAVNTLRQDFDTLVSGDSTTAIKTFNEIIAFLSGIEDSESLDSIIASIELQIAGKADTTSLAAVATSGSYNDLRDKPTIPTVPTEDNVAYPMESHTEAALEITPNVMHVWSEMAALTVTLGAEVEGRANEYIFQFSSGATATTLTLPSDLVWANGEALAPEASKTYQVSIVNGYAVYLVF